MFFPFLIFLIFLPIVEGFLISWKLREMYLLEFPLGYEVPEVERHFEQSEFYEQPDTERDRDIAVSGQSAESRQPEESVVSARPWDDPLPPLDDRDILPKTFKVDNILDSMLDEHALDVPEDISASLDDTNTAWDSGSDNENQSFFGGEQDEEDILARALDNLNSLTEDSENSIDFSEELFPNAFDSRDAVHPTIAPAAVELLGEDFDFDSLVPTAAWDVDSSQGLSNEDSPEETVLDGADAILEKRTSDIEDREAEIESPTSFSDAPSPHIISVHEFGSGLFQAESSAWTTESAPESGPLMSVEQRIVSVFPDSMVRDTVILPDSSAEAEQHCFVEESRPMFVRRSKRKS